MVNLICVRHECLVRASVGINRLRVAHPYPERYRSRPQELQRPRPLWKTPRMVLKVKITQHVPVALLAKYNVTTSGNSQSTCLKLF